MLSNVALLLCRTQFINYKYNTIHLKVCQTVSLFLCFVFSNSRSIHLNEIRRLKPSRANVVLQLSQLSTSVARRLEQALLNTFSSSVSGYILWDYLDEHQWTEITRIMVLDQMNKWIQSVQGFIGSFDPPWTKSLGSLILVRIIPKECSVTYKWWSTFKLNSKTLFKMEAYWTGYLLIKSPRMNNFQILCEIFCGFQFLWFFSDMEK